MLELVKESFLRAPDWRWKRATHCREKRKRLKPADSDSFLVEALRFSNEYFARRESDTFDELDIYEDYPLMHQAYTLYSKDGASDLRWEVEARLLSGQTDEEIAKLTSASPEVIDLYEKVFFNVRDRLDSSSYIIQVVMGRSIHQGVSDRDYDLIWKMYGYHGGPDILSAFINRTGLVGLGRNPISKDDIKGILDDAHGLVNSVRAAVANIVEPINGFTAHNIKSIALEYKKAELASAAPGSEGLVGKKLTEVMLSLPWSSGNGTIKHPVLDCMKDMDGWSAEPRIREIGLILNGGVTEEPIQEMRLPEPEGDNGHK
jgi:hypothetical protein